MLCPTIASGVVVNPNILRECIVLTCSKVIFSREINLDLSSE